VRTVVVVVVVDSLEQELEEEYPDGERRTGVRLRSVTGDGDGIMSIIWRSRIGVGFRFLTGFHLDSLCWTGWNCCSFRNSCRSRSDSMASSISRSRSFSICRISRRSSKMTASSWG
jgi:hypothetical protein